VKPPLSQLAKGKWASMLPKLGVEERFLTNRHGPCPICAPGGAGTDRFRFDDKDGKGTWICSSCGAGDGIELVKRVNGWEFKEAAKEIEKHIGTTPTKAVRMGRSEADVRAEMNAIWRAAKPLADVPAVVAWWEKRLGRLPDCPDLRAVRSLRCPGAGDFSAMVALVRDTEGKPVNLHRTFVAADGTKAPIPEPRRVMDTGLPKGCAVRLSPPAEIMGVAEGIETAAACEKLFDIPTWALLNAQNLRGFLPPKGVQRLVVFGDHDASFTGQAAAFDLARTCWAKRETYDPQLQVEVKVIGIAIDDVKRGLDWNDAWRMRMGDHARPNPTPATAGRVG